MFNQDLAGIFSERCARNVLVALEAGEVDTRQYVSKGIVGQTE